LVFRRAKIDLVRLITIGRVRIFDLEG
jgi:hypothetical protein